MNKILLTLFVIVILCQLQAQTVTQQWASNYTGTGENSDKFNAVIIDPTGNIYAAGYTWKEGNGKDFLLVKINTTGDTVWTKTYNAAGNGNDEWNDLTLDNAGNIVVTGAGKTNTGKDVVTAKYSTLGTLTWISTYNYTANLDDYGIKVLSDATGNIYVGGYGFNANYNSDYILLKYSSAGAQLALATYNGADNLDDELADLIKDATGNIIVTGKSRTSSNRDDYATVKYNASLLLQWEITLDQAAKQDRATALFTDAANDIYVTGRSSNGNDDDYVTVKMSALDGSQIWVKSFDLGGDEKAVDIAGNATQIAITGTTFNGVQTDIQTVVYNQNTGTQIWTTAYANAALKDDAPQHVAIDATGNVVVTGTCTVANSGAFNTDIILLKYNASGVQQWANIIGGNWNKDDNGSASLLTSAGDVYTVGALANINTMKDALVLKHTSAGVLQYNKIYNGKGEFTDKGTALCVSGGFTYGTGYTYTYNEDRNFCTIKYDASGNKLWTRTFNGTKSDTDEPSDIAADGAGNIYVAGRTKNLNNDYDMQLIKYNAAGDTIWTRTFDNGVQGDDEVNALIVDALGNVYVTGVSDDDASIAVNNNYMTVKYNSTGTLQWASPYNGTGNADDRAYSIALDATNNVYVTGRTWTGTSYDMQTIKYISTNGTENLFATYSSALGNDQPKKIAVDALGNVLVAGTSDRDATLSTNRDFIVIKYNNAGAQQWLQLHNGAGTGDDDLNDMVVDATGQIYVTGTSDLDSTATDNTDYTTIKYSATGAVEWIKTYNGIASQSDAANAIAIDATGNVYVTGQSNEGTSSETNNNSTTLVYSSTGNEIYTFTYDGTQTQSDGGEDILVTNGNIFVTGFGTSSIVNQRDFVTILYSAISGINEVGANSFISIYPNPAYNKIYLQLDKFTTNETAKFELLNVMGQLVISENKALVNASFQVDLQDIAKGVYIARLITDTNKIYTGRIIIQ